MCEDGTFETSMDYITKCKTLSQIFKRMYALSLIPRRVYILIHVCNFSCFPSCLGTPCRAAEILPSEALVVGDSSPGMSKVC